MSKPAFDKHLYKHDLLISMAIALTALSLLVSWGVELLANALFSIG